MAGRPKTRERNAAAAAAAARLGVDPGSLSSRSNVHTLSPVVDAQRLGEVPTQGRAHAPAGARTRARGLAPGRLQHAAVDANAEQQMRDFADVLVPESVVRIERLRPAYAAGVCEDFISDAGELAELIEHVRDEHGGQRYKLTLLSPNGTELMVFKLNVPGAPRFEGKPRTRSYWTGDDEPRERNAAPASVASSSGSSDATMTAMFGLLTTVLERALAPQRDNGADVVATVREIAQTSAQQTGALLSAIAQQQSTPQRSIVDQLNEVAVAHRAIGKLREAIVDDDSRALPPSTDDEGGGLLGGALKQAATSLLVQGFQNTQAARQRAPQRQVAPQQQPPAAAPQPQQAPAPQATNVQRVQGRTLRSAE